jgi:hypothetical protein
VAGDEEEQVAERWNEMIRRVHDYGQANPSVVVGWRVEEGPPDKLVVLLWGADSVVAEHRRVLSELVGQYDVLAFERARWSRSQIDAIRADIAERQDRTEGVFKSSSEADGKIHVRLRADQEPVAENLHERYGDAVVLTVGRGPYPPDRDLTWHERRLQAARQSTKQPPPTAIAVAGLRTRLELVTPRVRPGEDGRGRVLLHNDGTEPIELHTNSSLVGWVADAVTGEVLGGFTGARRGTGRQISLDPGDNDKIWMIFGTASSRRDHGYTISSGRYLVQTHIPVHEYPPEPDRPCQIIVVPPAELTIQSS